MNRNIRILAVALVAGLGPVLPAQAQYYYKDIINNKEVIAEMGRLKEQKIKAIKVTSLESNGMESEGFFCVKKLNRSYTEMEVNTSTSTSYPNIFTSLFSKEGLLTETIDSSEVSATHTTYTYDNQQRLTRISSITRFAEDENGDNEVDMTSEDHTYEYGAGKSPVKMTLVKNNKDTVNILFQPDESGNVAIEKNSRTAEIYYYYYDAKGRLTDVVHGYAGNKKLVPDFKFEYNSAGLIAQMITSEKEGAFFFTWKYNYDGLLRIRERCYSKEGSLMGSAEYEYK